MLSINEDGVGDGVEVVIVLCSGGGYNFVRVCLNMTDILVVIISFKCRFTSIFKC